MTLKTIDYVDINRVYVFCDEKKMPLIQTLVKTLIPNLFHLADDCWIQWNEESLDFSALRKGHLFVYDEGTDEFQLSSAFSAMSKGAAFAGLLDMEYLDFYRWGKKPKSACL